MSTPYFDFFGIKPDYWILFLFGCIGAFCRPRDGNHTRNNFESQCMLGIALGRSEYTNGMVFYNPLMDSFCTSANYLVDKNRHVGEVFPSLRYDDRAKSRVMALGDLEQRLWSWEDKYAPVLSSTASRLLV